MATTAKHECQTLQLSLSFILTTYKKLQPWHNHLFLLLLLFPYFHRAANTYHQTTSLCQLHCQTLDPPPIFFSTTLTLSISKSLHSSFVYKTYLYVSFISSSFLDISNHSTTFCWHIFILITPCLLLYCQYQ